MSYTLFKHFKKYDSKFLDSLPVKGRSLWPLLWWFLEIKYGWSDTVWLLRIGYKRHCSFCLSLSQENQGEFSLVLWKTDCPTVRSYLTIRSLKTPYREVLVERNWGLLPTASEEPWPPANVRSCESAILKVDPEPGQAFRWLQAQPKSWWNSYENSWTRTKKLSHLWILDQQNQRD